MEEQTGNLQQRDTSEEDIEDSDMDEATEVGFNCCTGGIVCGMHGVLSRT